MNDCLWLDDAFENWQKAVQEDRKPHAVIVNGGQGVGKAEFIKNIVATMLCSNSNQLACQNCQNCHLFKLGTHPDVFEVQPEKQIIKVKNIRDLIGFYTSTPHCSQHKIAVIYDAHLMNKSSSNALLKILEEPPASGTLFLLSHAREQLLSTIRSRCVDVNLFVKHDNYEKIINWIVIQASVNEKTAGLAFTAADYFPYKALQIIQNDSLSKFNLILDDLSSLLNNKTSIIEIAKNWLDKELFNYFYLLHKFLMTRLFSTINPRDETFFSEHELNALLESHQISVQDISNITEKLARLMIDFNTQLKKKLLLETFLVEFKQIFKIGRS